MDRPPLYTEGIIVCVKIYEKPVDGGKYFDVAEKVSIGGDMYILMMPGSKGDTFHACMKKYHLETRKT